MALLTVALAGAAFAATANPPIAWMCAPLAVPGFPGLGGANWVYKYVFNLYGDQAQPLIEMKYDEAEIACRKGDEFRHF